jgi:signal transduction histidine kinase
MRLSPLFRTALFRLTLLHVAVFLGSALVLAVSGSLLLSLALQMEFRDEIEEELDSLAALSAKGRLIAEVAQREDSPEHPNFDYLVQSAGGEVLAGGLPAMAVTEGWSTVLTPEGEGDEPALANGRVLPDGSFLLVARDAEPFYETRDFIFDVLIWGLGLALPLAIAGGLATSRAMLRRIEAINRATIKIRSGSMAERVPISDVDDEFNRLGRNINAMLDGIEELTEGIRQVTNDIAHDLRTPLTRLRQDLERAQQEPGVESHDSLIQRSIARIDEVLDTFSSLLRISQIESGSDTSRFAWLDLSCLFRDLTDTFATVAEESGKVVNCEIAGGVTFFGDKTLLRQMIVNLIENCIQHTPAGTQITVKLGTAQSGAYAVISDTGPGVPAWARDKVFRRFFRLDESRKSRGNGLGLSLVAAIAKHHGIALELSDNDPGLSIRLLFSKTISAEGQAMKPARTPVSGLVARDAS